MGSKKSLSKKRMLNSMVGFIPQKVFLKIAGEKNKDNYEIFKSTLLYADISGFTAMSEKLTNLGREGAEELTKIINAFFEPLIQIFVKWGGDIYRFGGDAILSFFPDNGKISSSENAILAAKEAIDFVKKKGGVKTSVGTFKVKMHIGIVKGNVYFQDIKKDYFLGGKIAHKVMKVVEKASPGQIIVDATVKNSSRMFNFVSFEKGLWKFRGVKKSRTKITLPSEKGISEISKGKIDDKIGKVKDYLPDWLYKRIQLNPVFDQSDGEHRKIAAVFLHFSGIPYEKMPAKASKRLTKFYKIVRETVEKYDGYLNKMDIYSNSERMLIVFGFPTSYEDNEQRATLFAYEVMNHSNIKDVNVKIGINSGLSFGAPVGSDLRMEYTVMGDTVNLAARLAASAKKNSVVVSESIFNKTYSLFEYISGGKKKYKGKKEKIPFYILGEKKRVERAALTRWLSESEKLVGRKKEMKKFKELIGMVKKSKGQLLGITGEAGMGKSRLTQEFVKELNNKRFKIFEGNCLSYGKALSYYPWISILAEFFGILPTDSQKQRKDKIKNKVKEISPKLSQWLPVIGEVMGVSFKETTLTKFLDAKLRKQRFFDITFDFLKYAAKKQPLCVIIEDLHWIDSVSMELINYIGRNISNKNILFLLIFRPIREKIEFMEKDFYTHIILKELTKKQTAELTGNLLNIKSIPEEFKKLVMEKSQGNPFYTEEIVKSLIEQGFIIEGEKGGWEFTGNIKDVKLSDTVEGVILSRIDRLDIPERDVLQTASVLGREFYDFLIQGIYPVHKILGNTLESLRRLDLIKLEMGEGGKKYFFKHILTQEVAYSTLSFAKKREIHRKTGEFIEKKLKNRKEEFLGLLSHHFYQGRDYDKALLYSVEAGEKAKKVYANQEAIEFFTRAIDAYEKLEKK